MAQALPVQIGKIAIELEVFAVSIYNYLAKLYPASADSFLGMAEKESSHIGFWVGFLKRRGNETQLKKPDHLKIAVYKAAIKIIGRGLTLRLMERGEASSIILYTGMLSSPEIDEAERIGIQTILEDELVHEEELIKKQSEMGGLMTYIKDAVLGLNDGLVEILSVTTGLVGVYGSPYAVALGGLVVGTAGALSMGISTYTSSRSQRQVHEGILKRITSASRHVTGVFKDRVANYAKNKGYSDFVAASIARETTSNPEMLSDFIAEEEYGLREGSLSDPSKAAMYAGFANLAGALVPLAPYFFTPYITSALLLSLAFATISLAVTGFLVSLVANVSARIKVAEMIITGLGSALATYIIGWIASLMLGTRA